MHRIIFTAIVLLGAAWARAEHFDIDLTVQGAKDQATAHSDTDPPPQGVNPRPLCHAKKGEELTFQFFVASNFPHDTIKGVGVHYYIAPEKEAGKKSPPDPNKPAVLDGSFKMDFKPETGRVGLRQRLHIDQPGAYIVRVESNHSDSDHEHFAALDLVIDSGQETVVPEPQIIERHTRKESLMPAGLVQALTDQELRDLLALLVQKR